MKCPKQGCHGHINVIQRYKTTVEWELKEDGQWTMGTFDQGTHYHLFCSEGHESKCWGNELPSDLRDVVYKEYPEQKAAA